MDLKKKLIIGALGLATLTGTFTGNEGGLPPLYTQKIGNSYGINIGFFTEFSKGSKHYGLNLSVANVFNGGRINGANVNVITGPAFDKKEDRMCEKSCVDGLQLNIIGLQDKLEVNGVQIGLWNNCNSGRNVQVGIYNSSGSDEHVRRGFLFNQNLDR